MEHHHHQRISSARFSTSQLPVEQRAKAWSRLVSALAVVQPDASHAGPSLEASLTSYNLGALMLARCNSSAVHYVRDSHSIEHNLFDNYVLLQLLIEGNGLGRFDGTPAEIRRGDICLIDLARSTELRFNRACTHINVLISRESLTETQRVLHGRILREGQSLCRMLTEHLLQLFEMLPTLTGSHVDTMARATLAVLRICLDDHADTQSEPLSHAEALRARMLVYIDAHLANAELDAAMLQSDFRVSRATLYRIFAEFGGVTQCIREKRLHGAYNDLHSHPYQQISEVVFRWGFSCERQFQRAFMARFGMTPSAVRKSGEQALRGAPVIASGSPRFEILAPAPSSS